ncbi:MAG: multiple sugar transport system substrate-binding protein [Actinomycetota bacterium]|jgi:ABC-type glycerol-3-phosphate transport system substrate-binding protein|nr:multiple sugar transport system substrate-binding protein [Actinomycetota bacterium]
MYASPPRRRRHTGVAALTLCLAPVLVTACSSSSKPAASTSGTASSSSAVAATSSAASPATSGSATTAASSGTAGSAGAATAPVGKFDGAKVVLSRWAGDPWTSEQKQAASEWGTDTGGSVTIDAVPYENLHDKQALALSGAGGYDILYVHPSWFGEFAKAGYLAPITADLSDASKNPSGFSAASFLPSVLSQGAYNGVQYCLPDFVSTVLVAYRTDIFQQNNLQPPKTTDDVVADAKALNGKNGMAGIAMPGKATGAVADVMASLLTAQGNWWFDAAGKTSLDVAAATKAITFYAAAAKYAPSGMLNYAVDDASTAGAQGKAAMVISTTPSMSALEDASKSTTVGKWGYAPIQVTAGKPAGELIYWDWCISAKSSNKDAAYSFLQWYTSAGQQAKIAVQAATAGATKDFYTNTDVTSKLPFLPAMNQALTNTNPQPSLATWPKIQDQIETAVEQAILGKATPAQAADTMHKALVAGLGG